jgi:o-succinylbenzoate---CoA ligase
MATLPDFLFAQAAISGGKPALYFHDQEWTYRELHEAVSHLAGKLRSCGVTRGSRVAVHMPSSAHYVTLLHALMRLGAISIPLNTRLTQSELSAQLNLAAPDLCVYNSESLPVTQKATTVRFSELERLQAEPVGGTHLNLSDSIAIIFTSGSSGFAKAVTLTLANVYFSANASAYRLGVLPHDNWLCTLPLYHVGGLSIILRSALYGTSVTLQAGFNLRAVNEALTHSAITLASLVPTMLHRLLEHEPRWNPHLRLVLLGGAKAPETLLKRAAEYGVPVATTYGMTEASSQVATALPEDALLRPGTVGTPLMFTEVKIVDDQGNALSQEEVGEILVRGPTVMGEYCNDPAATRRALRGGWLHTGDIGYIDGDGYLYTLAKRTDLIVSGGENVYPHEVEAVLMEYSGVTDACVVGVSHPEWGEQVAALIVSTAPVQKAALQAFVRTKLAGYKVPRRMLVVEKLPLLANGKVDRVAVKAILSTQSNP